MFRIHNLHADYNSDVYPYALEIRNKNLNSRKVLINVTDVTSRQRQYEMEIQIPHEIVLW